MTFNFIGIEVDSIEGIQVGLEFKLSVLPWILATVKKYIFDGSISTLSYVEQLGGLLYNLCHLSDLNPNFDAPVEMLWHLGYLIFEKLGPTFHIQLLDESFELLVGSKISDL